MDRVLVVVPTYNEAQNIERVVGRIRAAVLSVDVLVVDDASPDGTGKLADRFAAEDSQVHVLHRPAKQGLGAAYIAGFRWGLERGYEIFVEMDADGSHRPEELPRLLEALWGEAGAADTSGADLVLGDRWIPGREVVNWPASR